MSLNDREILKQSTKGDLYPGFANPTTSSSLMPTNPREANFVRHVISLFDSFQILIWGKCLGPGPYHTESRCRSRQRLQGTQSSPANAE